MDFRASTQKSGMLPDRDDKEISDDDDDRNHKHRRRDTRSHSLENDDVSQQVYNTKPYIKRGSKPYQNGFHSNETWKKYGFTPLEKDSEFDQKRQGFTHLNQKIRGRESSQPFSVDSHSLFANSHGPSSWSQPFGLIQGIPNGDLDMNMNHMIHHPLGLQGTFRPTINPSSLNMGFARKQCRDFEEQGFCLRGDMCPMEHGVNRIVVEDVQSLSQFNLPVSLATTTLSIPPAGAGPSPSTITTTNTLSNSSKFFHGKNIIKHIDSTTTTSDFYDPDQPLWGNNSHTPLLPQSTNQPNTSKTNSLLDPGQSVDFDNEVFVSTRSYAQGTIKKRRELDSETITENVDLSSVKIQGKNGRMIRKPTQKAESTLFLNGIPVENNKRETLISHFKRFGEVIDVYIPLNSERAFVQFSKREEAEAALMAPDAVMGNRFIKVWWANRDNISNLPLPYKRKDDSRLTLQNDVTAPVNGNNGIKVVVPPLKKKLENLEVLKEEVRRKQEMLDQKRDDFRRKLEKLAKQATSLKGEVAPEQVAKKQKLLVLDDSRGPTSTTPNSSDHDTLDDMATNNSKSLDSKTTLASTLQDSPKLKSWPHVDSPVVSKRFKLDNRPTVFKITPPLPDGLADVAVLKEHFSPYGDFSKVQLDDKTPKNSAQIYFTTRHAAENAFLNAKIWKGHNLQFAWLNSNTSNQPKPNPHKTITSGDEELGKRETVEESNQSDLSK